MNKKFAWIVGGLLIWILIISGFIFYLLFSNTSTTDSIEKNKIRDPNNVSIKIPANTIKENQALKLDLKKNESLKDKDVANLVVDTQPSLPKGTFFETPKKSLVDDSQKKDPALNPLTPKLIPDNQISAAPAKNTEGAGGLTIRGHVIDLKTDRAIEGANVSFFSSEGLFFKRTITDKDGRFEAQGLLAIGIHIRLQKEHYINSVFKNYSLEELGQHILLKMDSGLIIKGIIKDKISNLAISGVSIELYRGNTILKKSDVSDTKGNFIVDAVPLGNLELVFTKLGYSQTSQTLNIELNAVANVEVFLEKSSALVVEVVTLGGFIVIPKIRIFFDGSRESKVYEISILSY